MEKRTGVITFLNNPMTLVGPEVKVGEKAPAFTVLDNDLTPRTLADYEGKVVVINFWATWCKPCVTELPYFDQLHASNTDPKTKIVLVSLDFKSQLKSVLMPFLKKNKISAEIVLLADNKYNDWLEKVHPDWSGTIPATLLLQGDLRQFAEREFHSLAELKGFVDEFKNKP